MSYLCLIETNDVGYPETVGTLPYFSLLSLSPEVTVK